jgi:hypothetical protein
VTGDVCAYSVLMAYWAYAAWVPTDDGTARRPGNTEGTPLVEGRFVTMTLWLLLLALVFVAWHTAQIPKKTSPKRPSEFMGEESGQMAEVTLHDEVPGTRPASNGSQAHLGGTHSPCAFR